MQMHSLSVLHMTPLWMLVLKPTRAKGFTESRPLSH